MKKIVTLLCSIAISGITYSQNTMNIYKTGGAVISYTLSEIDSITFTTVNTSTFTLGQSYGGGLIFYIDGSGQHGLIAAPSDLSGTDWGCEGTTVGTTSYSVGSGAQNTNLIDAGCSTIGIAAKVCSNLTLNGYSDWYLPSKDELYLMYTNLHLQGLGNFTNTSSPYWSSSQNYSAPATQAWALWFDDGSFSYNYKSNYDYVRAVRSF